MRIATLILSLVLITAAAYLSVKGVYRVTEERLRVEQFPVDVGETSDGPLISEVDTGKDYSQIAKRNLFDIKEKKPVVTQENKKSEAPKVTRLQLKLWGTIAGSGSQRAAIIEDGKTRKQLLLREGDKIQTAVVKEISRGEVLLAVNGKNEVLLIEKPAGAKKGAKGGGDHPGLPPPELVSEAEDEIEPDGELVSLDRETVQSAMQNVNELMRQARVRPHFTNGKPDGLRLSAVRPDSLFRKIGLKTGDIITGVNGDPIESVDDALRFYTSLKDADDVALQLRRGGVERSINYRVE